MNATIDISNTFLDSPRLIIRPWQLTDLYDFYNYARVDGVGQMAGWLPHKDIEESKKILNLFIDNKNTFALELKSNNKVIGSIGIEKYHIPLSNKLENQKGREIGYVLSKEYWGKGLMTEAVKKVINYCLIDVNLDFLICGYSKKNYKSKRVNDKCGFKFLIETTYTTQFDTIEQSNYNIILKKDYLSPLN